METLKSSKIPRRLINEEAKGRSLSPNHRRDESLASLARSVSVVLLHDSVSFHLLRKQRRRPPDAILGEVEGQCLLLDDVDKDLETFQSFLF